MSLEKRTRVIQELNFLPIMQVHRNMADPLRRNRNSLWRLQLLRWPDPEVQNLRIALLPIVRRCRLLPAGHQRQFYLLGRRAVLLVSASEVLP
jgi:hypothetical protein